MVVQPKPMVAGEEVFGRDGQPSILFLMAFLILATEGTRMLGSSKKKWNAENIFDNIYRQL